MKKAIFLLTILIILPGLSAVDAQNPFTTQKPAQHVSAPPMVRHSVFVKIAMLQHRLNQRLSTLIREFKTTRSMLPLMTLVLISFGYGVIHAAGPGHGKAVSLSLILSGKESLRNGLLFGIAVAVFHGLSGILFLLIMRLILQKGVAGALGSVTRVTQAISGGLIALLGIGLLGISIYTWIRKNPGPSRGHSPVHTHKGPIAAALVVGMVPCPGVVMVMLFSLSLGMIGLGILLGIAISFGMAVTLTTVVVLGIFGKKLSIAVFSKKQGLMETLERVVEIGGGLMVAILGLLLLVAAL